MIRLEGRGVGIEIVANEPDDVEISVWNEEEAAHAVVVLDATEVAQVRDALDEWLPSASRRDAVKYLQVRRRDCLRALRASTEAGADYWRWQGHAELARQMLTMLGAEVPQ